MMKMSDIDYGGELSESLDTHHGLRGLNGFVVLHLESTVVRDLRIVFHVFHVFPYLAGFHPIRVALKKEVQHIGR